MKDTAFPDRKFTPCTLAERSPDSSGRNRLGQEHWSSAVKQGYTSTSNNFLVQVNDSLAGLPRVKILAHWSSAVKLISLAIEVL